MDYQKIAKKLQEELEQMETMKQKIKASLKKAPDGKVGCFMAKGKYPQYYLINKDENGQLREKQYLKASEIYLAKPLVQKEYDMQLLKALEKQEKVIHHIIRHLRTDGLQSVYDHMPEAKKRLIIPHVLPDDIYIEQWNKMYEGQKNTFPITNGFVTERGEIVRSKSEKMIADKLFYEKIPYQYEASLVLKHGKIVYPDFVVLNKRIRKTYFLEHFGMMDHSEYCLRALDKIDEYRKNKIFLGEDLLITTESSAKTLDMNQVVDIIEHYLR